MAGGELVSGRACWIGARAAGRPEGRLGWAFSEQRDELIDAEARLPDLVAKQSRSEFAVEWDGKGHDRPLLNQNDVTPALPRDDPARLFECLDGSSPGDPGHPRQ